MLRWVALGLGFALACGPLAAQSLGSGLSLGTPALPATPIVTLNQDRLFAESLWGLRVAAELDAASETLAQENRALEVELAAEEQRLTEARSTMDPAAFRAEADAFDARVVRIRAEQDGKAIQLQRRTDMERQAFLQQAIAILTEIVAERGAMAILDERTVFLAADSIDITDEAIRRINTVIGQGEAIDNGVSPELSPELTMPIPDTKGEAAD